MIPANAIRMITRQVSTDRTKAPARLWAMPPCVNRYSDGFVSDINGEENIDIHNHRPEDRKWQEWYEAGHGKQDQDYQGMGKSVHEECVF